MQNANFAKNTILKSRANRKHITEFHKITKDVKKQVSLDVKQLTVTHIFDQVVFMGPEQIVAQLSEEMKATISGLFKSADNPSKFTSIYKEMIFNKSMMTMKQIFPQLKEKVKTKRPQKRAHIVQW